MHINIASVYKITDRLQSTLRMWVHINFILKMYKVYYKTLIRYCECREIKCNIEVIVNNINLVLTSKQIATIGRVDIKINTKILYKTVDKEVTTHFVESHSVRHFAGDQPNKTSGVRIYNVVIRRARHVIGRYWPVQRGRIAS